MSGQMRARLSQAWRNTALFQPCGMKYEHSPANDDGTAVAPPTRSTQAHTILHRAWTFVEADPLSETVSLGARRALTGLQAQTQC